MQICCIGDSLTEGDYGIFGRRGIANVFPENYPYFLACESGATVKNYGKCGYTATSYLRHYDEGNAPLEGADVVLILLGTNGGLDGDRDTPGNKDYETLVSRVRRDAPNALPVLITPPHATENPMMSNCGYAPQVKKAVAFVRDFAAREDLPLIDLADCGLFTAETEMKMQPQDGVHFSKEGYRTMAHYIWSRLSPMLAVAR